MTALELERDALEEVRAAADRRDAADVSYRAAVVAAADAGVSYAEIARAARITRQSARALVERAREAA